VFFIATCISVAREQLSKHVPAKKYSWPTTGKGISIAKQRAVIKFHQQQTLCFLCGPCLDYITIFQEFHLTLGLLNAGQFGFRARHSMTLQCMRLTDHVTLNFNNKMSMAAVFLGIEKACDTTWYSGLL
jgi:hypothetical protein